MKPAGKILQKVRRSVEAVAYGNPLYRKMLAAGETPDRLYFTLPDPWPGDSQAGLALMSTQGALFERPVSPRHAVALRNLRAVGTPAAQLRAIRLLENWLQQYDEWDVNEWAPDVLGERIGAWIGFYEFYSPAAPPGFIPRLIASLQRQHKHLIRTLPPTLNGVAGLRALKGLALSGLNFDESDKSLALASDMLSRQLAAEILSDGGLISRSPSALLHMLRHLIDIRSILTVADIEVPDIVGSSIQAMVPALKLFRHGDGGLALFHGSAEETPLMIDAALTLAEARGRVLRRLPEAGYERLTAGRSVLIADGLRPPPRGHDQVGHAGLGAFEFGQGKERLIVNCGEVEGATTEWRLACAATAAHSTVIVEDTNACEILEAGGVLCAADVTVHRFEQNGAHCVEISHDGYRQNFGTVFNRLLMLSADGEELRGRDILVGASGRHFAIRWHLHPHTQASLAQSNQAALLRTAMGNGWRLRVEGHSLQLEPSIYCGSGAPRRSLQLKVGGITIGDQTIINWTLIREKKSAASSQQSAPELLSEAITPLPPFQEIDIDKSGR